VLIGTGAAIVPVLLSALVRFVRKRRRGNPDTPPQ
jgi:hypothetical protein